MIPHMIQMEGQLPEDLFFMKKALNLGEKARMISPPNPWVGCVIVNKKKIVGKGFTQVPGKAHAEIVALREAQNAAKGATAYVTLEPCVHFGRTPPCVNALIEAGVSRVVIGIQDPDEKVFGKGISALRKAGINVVTGVLSDMISRSLAPYLYHRKTSLPFCLLKAAITIDGHTAAKDGSSQWISSPEARQDAHMLRAQSQAIIIGAGTAIKDLPALTVRGIASQPATAPLRVILDAKGQVPANGPLFDTSLAPTLIITTSSCPKKMMEEWKKHEVMVEIVPDAKNAIGLDLMAVLKFLGKRGVIQALVEGGSRVFGTFLEANLMNQLTVYVGNMLLGSEGFPLFATDSMISLAQAKELQLLGNKILGNSVRLDYAQINKELPDGN